MNPSSSWTPVDSTSDLSTPPAELRVDVYLGPGDRASALRHDARVGLTAQPKVLPPKWFYDDRGSALFEAITRLPEYYLTRAERSILQTRARAIVKASEADTLVELGSGASEKTRLLLDAMARTRQLRRYVPFDVSEGILRASGEAISADFGVAVHGVVGDFEQHLSKLPKGGRRLMAFLGSTLGNLAPGPRGLFLRDVAAQLVPGDSFLIGTDLVKDPNRLQAAYDDSAGLTALFNKNVLRVLARELEADFDEGRFNHSARWDAANEWMELGLRVRASHVVSVPVLNLEIPFEAGELLHTEISAKFRRESLTTELADAGFAPAGWWTNPAGDYAMSLWRRRE